MNDFWESRPRLRHVRDFARGRRVCPWSTLGVVLVRVSCHIPPHVYLPPIVGGRAALNLFCALVGPPGAGKGASENAGRDAIKFDGNCVTDLPELPIGSGEGIARTFSEGSDCHSALFTAPEVDSLAALFSRQGATLQGELRSMWTGDTLGFTNAAKTTRTCAPRLTYRAGLIVGVQPLRAHALLAGADGGTPQRFIWMPVLDAQRPEQRPETPEPITVAIPTFPPGELVVPEVAIRAIDDHQNAVNWGVADVDALDGHALLCRLKVACALMALDSRAHVSDEDWHLAGVIMAVSDQTRAAVQAETRRKARSLNRARALDTADREEAVSDRKLQRAREAIMRRLEKHPQQTRGQLYRALKADVRDYCDTALAELQDSGEIRVSAGDFELSKGHVSPGTLTQKAILTSGYANVSQGTRVPVQPHVNLEQTETHRRRERNDERHAQQTSEASQ